MYDYALALLREAKKTLEEQFKAKNYESVEHAMIERGYICDIEDALMTLESIAEDSEEQTEPKLDDLR